MSQAKVEHYKEQKKNRKKLVKREHRERRLAALIIIAIIVVIAIWIAVSAVQQAEKYHEENPKTTEVNLKDLVNFDLDTSSDSTSD